MQLIGLSLRFIPEFALKHLGLGTSAQKDYTVETQMIMEFH